MYNIYTYIMTGIMMNPPLLDLATLWAHKPTNTHPRTSPASKKNLRS